MFSITSEQAKGLSLPRVPLRYVFEYLMDGETPGRVLNDCALRGMLKGIAGPGTVYELGGAGDYYKDFMPAGQPYVVTNIDPDAQMIVDATSMPFEDNSIDAFMSMFALEHIYDFQAVIDEAYRCLKPGGRFLLAVPFLYYYHAAPDDFFRFTRSALDRMLSRFAILQAASFGNRGLLIGQLMHEKRVLGSRRDPISRAIIRLFCSPLVLAGLMSNQNNPVYAITQLYLVEKPTQKQP